MIRYISYTLVILLLSLLTREVSGQYKLQFGNITLDELSDKPYKPDPGAAALVLSNTGIATLDYQGGFYISLEVDVRKKIVNSKGYDYADIEIPYDVDDNMDSYRASTFNLRNGEKVETKIPRENFITERTSQSENTLKFNFTDVHEGSVIEYSYRMRLRGSAIFTLVPWEFQDIIPVLQSSLTVACPDAFVYKQLISGISGSVHTDFKTSNVNFFKSSVNENIQTFYAANMPAFRTEPMIVSDDEYLTRVTFELSRVDFPNVTLNDISPTYTRLNTKLLDRDDFGTPLSTSFKSLAEEVTAGSADDLSKLKKIYKYVSDKVLWNGLNDYTSSAPLRTILRKEKGNSADINMILIAMLRSAGIKAEPVILSTRSHGSLNQFSAMYQQFDYLVAAVTVAGKTWLVDATDPLRPFNLLPFECLNGAGRLIHLTESGFVDLKNDESYKDSVSLDLNLDKDGNLTGNLEKKSHGYSAYNIRKVMRLESEEGYTDIVRYGSPNADMTDFRFEGVKDPYSDITIGCNLKISNMAQVAADKIILNQVLNSAGSKNPFYSAERRFPVDFGCPRSELYSLRLKIPEGFSVIQKPSDVTFSLPEQGGKYEFSCVTEDNTVTIKSSFLISKPIFQTAEYSQLREFYDKIFRKESEMIILKKNPVTK